MEAWNHVLGGEVANKAFHWSEMHKVTPHLFAGAGRESF